MGLLARLFFGRGHTEAAVDLLQDALGVADRAGAPRTAATILGHLAQLARFVEAREDAIARCDTRVSLLRACGDRVGQAECQLQWARLALSDMDADSAIAQLESALSIARDGGMKALEAKALAYLGVALRISGDLGTALDRLAEAAALAEDDPTLSGFIHAHRGAVEAAWDRVDVAKEAFAQAQAHLEESGDALYSTVLDVLMGFIDVARGREAATREDERTHGDHVERALNRLARGSSFETRSTPPRGEETAWRLADLRVARLLLDTALSSLIPNEAFSG
jgi:tetratricopeptide (TPR) repeat protein